jgi:trans-aconitate 2-methyltransferase
VRLKRLSSRRETETNAPARPYTFGDSELAAERLRLLAEVFGPTSRDFLLQAAGVRPQLALDLGCGPGDTTWLLAETLSPDRTVGLEGSPSFLDLARKRQTDRVSFVEHDVTEMPFPPGRADLIYSRFLLLHLPERKGIVARWVTQLRQGGLLLLEEVDRIDTVEPVLLHYLEIVAAMMAGHGQQLYAGKDLAAFEAGEDWHIRLNRIVEVVPGIQQAARMFSLNLAGWRDDPVVEKIASRKELERLSNGLEALAAASTGAEITWGMRQVVLERR